MEKLDQLEEESSGLQSWLGEVETFLEAEDTALGDVETLQAQLEQSNVRKYFCYYSHLII